MEFRELLRYHGGLRISFFLALLVSSLSWLGLKARWMFGEVEIAILVDYKSLRMAREGW